MRLRARFEINGMSFLGPEAWSYGDVFDGQYMLRFPPMGVEQARELTTALQHPSSLVAVTVWIDGLPTVAELATRLATVELALEAQR